MNRCPICGKPVEPDSPFLPFCGDRCRIIDLGNWASDQYVIPGKPVAGETSSEEGE